MPLGARHSYLHVPPSCLPFVAIHAGRHGKELLGRLNETWVLDLYSVN
jgi:hypothetical protein